MKLWFYRLCRGLIRPIAKVYFRMRGEASDRIPATGPILIVANHCSHLDPPLLGSFAGPRPVRFLARSSLGKVPLLGRVIASLGTLLIRRDGPAREGIELSIGALERGEVVCIFAEGTRSRDGQVAPFERGLILILRRAPDSTVVVPAGLTGTFGALPRGKVLPRPRTCRVRYGQPVTKVEVLGAGGLDRLRETVVGLVERPQSAGSGGSNSSDRLPESN